MGTRSQGRTAYAGVWSQGRINIDMPGSQGRKTCLRPCDPHKKTTDVIGKALGVDHHGRHGSLDGTCGDERGGGVKDPDCPFRAGTPDDLDVLSEFPDLGGFIIGDEQEG